MTIAFENYKAGDLPRVPPDINQAFRVLKLNCGPVSLAALLGTPVIEVNKFFPQFPERDYTTQADMEYALSALKIETTQAEGTLPDTGVALIQMDGPWSKPGAPIRAQLRYTHWIASMNGFAFDLNVGDWIEREEWWKCGAMSWMREVPKCVGFHVRSSIAVTPRPFEFSPFGRIPKRPK